MKFQSKYCRFYLRRCMCPQIGDYFTSVNIHYDVIMSTIASQITSLTVVYSTVYSGADQSKHQSSASLAFVWGIHRGPVNSPHKWPVTLKMFSFDDVIMNNIGLIAVWSNQHTWCNVNQRNRCHGMLLNHFALNHSFHKYLLYS